MKNFLIMAVVASMVPILAACSSIAKGATEAILEHKKEDTSMCEIAGPPFDGVQDSLNRENNQSHHTKVLMVHGIGKHLPDYSAHFREKLVRSLKLDSMDPTVKRVELVSNLKNGEPAGLL